MKLSSTTEEEMAEECRAMLVALVLEAGQVTWAYIVHKLRLSVHQEPFVGRQLSVLVSEKKLTFWKCYYMFPKELPRTLDSEWNC